MFSITTESKNKKIVEEFLTLSKVRDFFAEEDCTAFSDQFKWYDVDKEMCKFSVKYPDEEFLIRAVGEDNMRFYNRIKNGKSVDRACQAPRFDPPFDWNV